MYSKEGGWKIMLIDYRKYDPYNRDFDDDEFMEWMMEHIHKSQYFNYHVDYDCYEGITNDYREEIGVINNGSPPKFRLCLNDYIIPAGSYIVLLSSGILSFVVCEVMEELILPKINKE